MNLVDRKYYIFLECDLMASRTFHLSLNEMGGFETWNNSGRVGFEENEVITYLKKKRIESRVGCATRAT